MIKRIHINQHKIRSNKKNNKEEQVITVKTSKNNYYADEVEVKGSCKVIYKPNKPLSCGARVWIETSDEVIMKDHDLITKIL
ncbi:hypothetical protein [Hyphomonas sp.]|jgi:hypothetical protein|uniref:hypothetical protein n=1 Tax=Hyphomonas sp. TaxID=87 RepID=UPI000C966F3E|nr:hypothetical protein [Hyphomonas sp.]MAL44277.1 hypothetical protein [Hyphomonas sp.]|tara:strand:+ start:204 stop:449 length:246 start_codon:yes stop_codon:yes gene_type:complete